jgi:hypothetical protein
MAASFLVGLVIVLAIRMGAGPGERVDMALRATARWSFLLFWLASAGSALATLFGSRFQALAHRASLAFGFPQIPCELKTRDFAEVARGYRTPERP